MIAVEPSKGIKMNRFPGLITLIVLAFVTQTMSANYYIMLTNSSLNAGEEFNNFDINIGIGLNYHHNRDTYATSYSFVSPTNNDTTYLYNNETTVFEVIPGLHIAYYFGNKDIRPFLQLSTYMPLPLYNKLESDGSKTDIHETIASGSVIFGIDYKMGKISIGGGIGPSMNYDKSNYVTTSNPDPQYYKNVSNKFDNSNLDISIDMQFRLKYYF